jgi:hypothetical protein
VEWLIICGTLLEYIERITSKWEFAREHNNKIIFSPDDKMRMGQYTSEVEKLFIDKKTREEKDRKAYLLERVETLRRRLEHF